MNRLLRWFLAHDPTTACQLEVENEALKKRAGFLERKVAEAEVEIYMRSNADALLAAMESPRLYAVPSDTPLHDDLAVETFRAQLDDQWIERIRAWGNGDAS